jgi:glycosyltransferase involved in cell wall biosynthesis
MNLKDNDVNTVNKYDNCELMSDRNKIHAKFTNKNKLHPLVSACITTYDRPNQALCAIQSALSQTYGPLEIIVVEDGSNTGVEEWIQKNQLTQIKYIRHDKNLGLASARNTGISYAKGKYIAFLDDDDEWESEKIQKQISLYEELDHKYAVVYCGMKILSNNSISINSPSIRGNLKNKIIAHGLYTIPSSCVYNRTILLTIGGYDLDLKTGIDHDLWMKIAKNEYFVDYVDESLVKHISSNMPQMTTDVSVRIIGVDKYLDKWRPTIIEWFGRQKGEKYCLNYYTNVIGGLGFSIIKNGEVLAGRKILWSVFIKNPKGFILKPALLLVMIAGKAGYTFGRKINVGLKKLSRFSSVTTQ